MKKISIICALLISMIYGAYAQNVMDNLFDKYNGKEGFTSVNISSEMFNMMGSIQINNGEKDKDLEKIKDMKDFASKLTGLKVLTTNKKDDEGNAARADAFYKEVMGFMPKNIYRELMEVNDEGQKVNFYVKRTGSKVSELVVVVKEKKETSLISLTGDIDLNKVAEFSKDMNIKGMDKIGDKPEK
jgi:hypothetical protein